MADITVRLNGKEITVPFGTRILDLIDGNCRYADDPIAGAVVNGIQMSLQEVLKGNADIETYTVTSSYGKRAYRKTLCFLLSYASSKIAPERNLIIGHSLGDGFYFRYRDDNPPETERLYKEMKRAVAANIPIAIRSIPEEEALGYARRRGLLETEKLLVTRNSPIYKVAEAEDCIELYYEPLLPSFGYLELWELREYQKGLLLRYPQQRNPFALSPFADNPLLFSVFHKSRETAAILGIESLGSLNAKVADGSIKETIRLSEALYRKSIMEVGIRIKEKGTVKAVMIAGPSSSGKTTSSMKLCDELRIHGYDPIKLSLDDYYLPGDQIPLDEDGEKDFDVLESLDLELFDQQLKALTAGESIHLAEHDFAEKTTSFRKESTRMKENSILVIEGIHALNPKLTSGFPDEMLFKVYISALTQINLDTRSRISTTDNRILRRMVRDARTRGLSPVETLTRWPSVERGEKNNIFPYQNNADALINSALSYELSILVTYAVPLLRSVRREDGPAYTTARRLLGFLNLVHPMPDDDVPSDSILREFIGGSLFGAI